MAAFDIGASSSSSSSSSGSFTSDVFLNFRGKETRNNFTGFLHKALEREGINVFIDSEGLWGGEEIKSTLLRAIQQSKISIPVFSEGYADSKWCLMELVEIVRCHTSNGQKILPIFLDVDPRDVRNQKGSFEESFQKHNGKFDAQTIKSWREALSVVGGLSGYDLKQVNMNQPELVKLVVDWAWSELSSNCLAEVKYPIGLEDRVNDLSSMLNLGSNDVRFVGICGIGGIGKTSIAMALYNRIFKSFKMSSFLANVREGAARPDGLVSLQRQLIYDIFKKEVEIWNSYTGQQLIKEKLCGKNVLLILDDVDSDDQLKHLAIEVNLCGPGSRIIITSRDEHILNLAKVNEIYYPPELDDEQSLRLFSWHVFSGDQPPEDYKQLSRDVLYLAGGLPLTLKVLGSFLFDKRDKKEWESMLNKLQRIPHADVLKKLRISYDNLEEDEKSIFLDVACFFVGWRTDGIISMWEACGFNPISALRKLTQRSLLKFTNAGFYINNRSYSYEVLRMHDQIQAMGRGIVFEESPREPSKRSRLWYSDEILAVLEEQKGTEAIEGILLASYQMDLNVCLHTKHFAMMSKLRFLNIHGVAHLEGDFQHLPSTLTWFRSTQCPMESGNFYLKKLVYMDLSRSQIRQAWTSKPQNENQRFNKLKFLHLQECRYLNESPNFLWFPNLETLDLSGCFKMVNLHKSIGDLKSLVTLYLDGTKIKELPNNICMLSSLKVLRLNQCSSLKSLPESIGDLKSLVSLYLDDTKIEELPNNICMLSSLKDLSLRQCSSLKSLPESIGDLKSLVKLHLDRTKIEEFPNNICMLSSLKDLSLRQCSSLKSLPESIGDLKSLVTLYLNDTKIEELPNNICMLSSLKDLSLYYCSSLKSLPESIGDLKSLVTLDLDGTKFEELPNNICMLSSLEVLSLSRCSSLKSLPESIGDLESLVKLHLDGTKIEELPNNICMLSSLQVLSLRQCSSLKSLPESIGDLKSLVLLYLDGTKIEELPNNICMLSSLKDLSLSQCSSLKSLPKSIGDLKSLVKLLLDGTKIKEFPNSICKLSSLKTLNLCGLESLNELPKPISNLESLGELFLSGTHIKELPNDFGCLEKLVELRVKDCHNLVKLPIFEGRPSRLRRINLIGTSVLPSSYDSLVTLHSLEELKIGNKLETSLPPWISGLRPLERLKLRGYTRLESLPDLSSLTNLKELTLRNCEKLNDIGGIKGIKSLKQLYMENCYTITNARRKIFGQGTLLVDDVGLQTSEYSLNVDDGDDGVCKGLILCIVFAFTQPNQEQEEVWQEGELLNNFQLILMARIHRKHGSYFDCTICLPMKGVKLTTERDSIYIHHFKGSDLFGIPLEGTNAIEICYVEDFEVIEYVDDRYRLDCDVKFWKVLLLKGREWDEQEIPNKQLDCSEVRRMVADFFKWTSHDEDAGTGSSLSGEDARGEMRKMVVSQSSSDGDDDNESSSFDDCETSSFRDDDDESLYDDCESSFLDDDGSLFALN